MLNQKEKAIVMLDNNKILVAKDVEVNWELKKRVNKI